MFPHAYQLSMEETLEVLSCLENYPMEYEQNEFKNLSQMICNADELLTTNVGLPT